MSLPLTAITVVGRMGHLRRDGKKHAHVHFPLCALCYVLYFDALHTVSPLFLVCFRFVFAGAGLQNSVSDLFPIHG